MVETHDQRRKEAARLKRWQAHNDLERGNPIRIYEGKDFRKRK